MRTSTMTIGRKLALSFTAIVGLMLLLSGFTLYRMYSIDAALESQNSLRTDKLERLYVAREALAQTGLAARNAYIFDDAAEAAKELDILDRQKAIYLKEIDAAAPLFRNDEQFEKVRRGLLAMAEELKRPRQYREAGRMQEFGVFLVKECSPLRRQIVNDIDLLVTSVEQAVDTETKNVVDALRQSETVTLAMSVLALLLATGIGILITRSLLKQLGGEPATVTAIANRIAQGDLTVDIHVQAGEDGSV
ncbi:MAG: MCP four helix bundle domain-containing protein, partial [Burkholderiaceae bacterium]